MSCTSVICAPVRGASPPALKFSSTCAGRLAPGMAQVTAGAMRIQRKAISPASPAPKINTRSSPDRPFWPAIRSSTRKDEREVKDEDYYACERWAGAFTRRVMLPPGLEPEKMKAVFRNGVLEVHVPKTKEAKAKKIEIKVE